MSPRRTNCSRRGASTSAPTPPPRAPPPRPPPPRPPPPPRTGPGPLSAPARAMPTIATVHGPVRGELGDYYSSLGSSVGLVAISQTQRRLRPRLAWAGTVHNSVQVERFPYQVRKSGYVLWLA